MRQNYDQILFCYRCNFDLKVKRTSNARCDKCLDTWLLYPYELDKHNEEMHAVSGFSGQSCMICDYAMMVPNLNVSKHEMVGHKEKEHNYVMHYLCRNEECSVMFHSSKSVEKHDNREYTINKEKTYSMYLDARNNCKICAS